MKTLLTLRMFEVGWYALCKIELRLVTCSATLVDECLLRGLPLLVPN